MEYASAVRSPYSKENINKIRCCKEGQLVGFAMYSPYSSVADILSNLGRRALEFRRYDSRIAMFYKTVYGLVAIPVPPYFERSMVLTRHHPLAYSRSILLSVIIILMRLNQLCV